MKTKTNIFRKSLPAVCLVVVSLIWSCEPFDPPRTLKAERTSLNSEIPVETGGNVHLMVFSSHDFFHNGKAEILISDFPYSRSTRSTIHWYLVHSSGQVFSIPGFGHKGETRYKVLERYNHGDYAEFEIIRGTGPGEAYSEIRAIVVEADKDGNFPALQVNFSDYHQAVNKLGI
ncbi:hypothetical protein [Pararhodonellum marinum]|uniref:hypothetical protein n=1 Tax=Pararhodonellum marinum TaxID=2755358 RepID=UPI00188FAA9D|nr:hypothetical protein [Pararhodonellum marinum]